jgi:hypothetical protein
MKKQKIYFGKQHLDHNEGKRNGKFVVPRMFHRYFTLRHKLARWSVILKMAINSSNGAVGHNMHVDSDHFTEMLKYRRRIAMTLRVGLGVTRMQSLLNSIEQYRDEQAQVTKTQHSCDASLVRSMATRGYYEGVKKLDHGVDVEMMVHRTSCAVVDPAIPSPPSMEKFTQEQLESRRQAKADGNHDLRRPGHCELYPGNLTQCLTDQCRVHPK